MSSALSTRRRSALGATLGVVAVLWSSAAFAQVGPEESTKKLKPAEGLEATLFASEPMVNNPTNIDVDSRGRVWVAEGQNYRMTHRKELPRIEGADRIKILEDTDGDGKADKVTVFADNIFPIPMGLAVEEKYGKDGKYLGCPGLRRQQPGPPGLRGYRRRRQGRQAIGPAHRLRRGRLRPRRPRDDPRARRQALLHPRRRLLLVRGEGRLAPEPELRRRRQVGPARQLVEPGQHPPGQPRRDRVRDPRRPPAEQLRDQPQRLRQRLHLRQRRRRQPRLAGDLGHGRRLLRLPHPGQRSHWGEEVPGNVPKLVGTGNGSLAGSWSTKGRCSADASIQGCLFEADAGTRQINFFPIERHGSNFRTEYKVLLASDDPWFRPVDMTAAPDGSVFVADWYDAGVGGHAFRDQDTGRIYRVAPKGNKAEVDRPSPISPRSPA